MHTSKDESEIDKTSYGEVRGSLQLQIRCQFVCESKLRRSHAGSDATPNLSWRWRFDRSYAKVCSWKQPPSMDDVTWVLLDKTTESAMHGLVRLTLRKFYSLFLSTSNPLVL
jgi:hypothetical protein